MSVAIRQLEATDRLAYRRVRLNCLREFPDNFGSSYEEQSQLAELPFEANLAVEASPSFLMGAFDGEQLVGICAFVPETRAKTRHRGELHQVYVSPVHAGRGVGRRLVQATVEAAFARPGIEQITLGVIAGNEAANRLYQSLGFTEYGFLENSLLVNGCYLPQRFMVLKRPSATTQAHS
ncbi:N-acetyltransferase [Hymenobacter sp.]|uniref:GNAT family N-acetyltransferase n=1 Tax=Hymenobacter sp. TaxID=1898978 RepID=UPI00286A14B6|nr:N-acetyltransferase [Hymenobacter sp.]